MDICVKMLGKERDKHLKNLSKMKSFPFSISSREYYLMIKEQPVVSSNHAWQKNPDYLCSKNNQYSPGLDGDQRSVSIPDIASLGPGAYGLGPTEGATSVPAYMERMSTDISALKKQYAKLKQRQNQAHIILACRFH